MKFILILLLLPGCYNRYDDTLKVYYHQYKYKDNTIRLVRNPGFKETRISAHKGS